MASLLRILSKNQKSEAITVIIQYRNHHLWWRSCDIIGHERSFIDPNCHWLIGLNQVIFYRHDVQAAREVPILRVCGECYLVAIHKLSVII